MESQQHYYLPSMHPWVMRLLCSVPRRQALSLWCASVGFNLTCQFAMHRDSHNHSILPSAIIPASMFQGARLWVEDSDGQILVEGVRARAIEITFPCVTFQSRLRHATGSWTGNRLVVILYLYHIHQAWRLPGHARRCLTGAGFQAYPCDVMSVPCLQD